MPDEDRIKDTVTNFLVHFPFFNQLDAGDMAIVAQHIDFTEIEAGSTLFKEGDDGDCIYFVVDGELDVIKESVSGSKTGIDRVVIATMCKGCSIGEMSIIDNVPRSATVTARTDATMVTLTQEG
ncbi:MAG: cyclic nucleotide-binding domain-containing protein, partial [Deltaproteobacteria bacterium]|nr:cyclic nucleotide-binding domain-containing protein [Deltaproteobacteria bacterium]